VLGSSAFETSSGRLGRLGPAQGCTRIEFSQSACELAQSAGLDAVFAIDGVDHRQISTPEGFDICVASTADSTAPSYIFARRDEPVSAEEFGRMVAAKACPSSPLDGSASTVILDCSAEGFQSLWAHFVPGDSPDADGFVASLDAAIVADRDNHDLGDAWRALESAFDEDPYFWLPGPDEVDPEEADA
jgi:hypothetical protein